MEVLLTIAGVLAGLVAFVLLIMVTISVGRLVLVASLFVRGVVGLAAIIAWWFVGSVLWWCLATSYMALVVGTAPFRIDVTQRRRKEADRSYLASVGLLGVEASNAREGDSGHGTLGAVGVGAQTLPRVHQPPSHGPVVITAVLVGIFVIGPRARNHLADRSQCQEARLEDTADRWARYLEARPGGLCSEQARNRREAISCERAHRLDSERAWVEYLAKTPAGRCAAEAAHRYQALACERLRLEDTEQGYTEYLEANPQGSCAELAEGRIGELACENAREEDTERGWTQYLAAHPEGVCVGLAEDRIRDLACESACAEDSYTGLTAFLDQFGRDGACARRAAARVEDLGCRAGRTGEITWLDYVLAHPEGACVEEANEVIQFDAEWRRTKGR